MPALRQQKELPALQQQVQVAQVTVNQASSQADQYRELFATVLARVQRSYAQEVELSPMIAAALNPT